MEESGIRAEEVGAIVLNCSIIESYVNLLIEYYSKDPILFAGVLRNGLARKAELLKKLLTRERTDLDEDYINKLIQSIKNIGNKRNIVAHNPITIESTKTKPDDVFISYTNKKGTYCKYTRDELFKDMELSYRLIGTIRDLFSDDMVTWIQSKSA